MLSFADAMNALISGKEVSREFKGKASKLKERTHFRVVKEVLEVKFSGSGNSDLTGWMPGKLELTSLDLKARDWRIEE